MNTQKPLKVGLKYGAMKMKKGMPKQPCSTSLGGCGTCGNMEHTGCLCHMLGAGRKTKKGGIATQEEMEKLTPTERRKLKSQATKQSQIETKKKMKEEEEARQNNPAYDELYNKQDKAFAYFKSPEYIQERDRIKSLTPAQRAREMRNLNKQNEELKLKREEEEKRKEQESRKDGDWLDKAFDFATDKIIDVGSKAIGTFIPNSEGIIKKGATALKEKLQGLGKPQSEKQKQYQEALNIIKKKYNMNHKEAMTKYKQIRMKTKN